MDWFKRVINLCAFHDWGFMGSPFTWSKNNGVEGKIHVRLDRALANNNWLTKFLRTKLHYIAMSTSDHHLLVLCFLIAKSQSWGGGKLFRFEEMWLQDPRCDEVVQEAWQEGLCKQGGVQFENYMESCRARLVSWNKLEFGHVGRKIAEIQKRLQSQVLIKSDMTSREIEVVR